jgi:uncharacterized protein (TIGR03118 family)
MRAISSAAVVLCLISAGCEPGEGIEPPTATTPGAAHGAEAQALAVTPVVGIATQVNLVSDRPGHAAVIDPDLVNAWGLAFAPSGRAWVSSTEGGRSQVYDSAGGLRLSVLIPPPPGGATAHPTGQVFNGNPKEFKGDAFIFVTEDGTIAGWPGADPFHAVLRVDNSASHALYKGVTILRANGKTRLFAADFHNAKIDVFDENYQPLAHPGRFEDTFLPFNYAPFNGTRTSATT